MIARRDDVAERAGQWQFTLRAAMVGVTAFSAILGLAVWKGVVAAAGCVAAASACFVGLAVYRRRKRAALCAGACLFVGVLGLALYFFGPQSVEHSICRVCDKHWVVATFLGVKWYDKERDSELSKWYRRAGLRAHDHRWTHFSSTVQTWRGDVMCYDSFGFGLYPLDLLREASKEVDPPTFEDLAEQYWAACQAPDKWPDFAARCRKIVPAEHAAEPDS